jgi:hypothetical protein
MRQILHTHTVLLANELEEPVLVQKLSPIIGNSSSYAFIDAYVF